MNDRIAKWSVPVLAFLGLADSGYLASLHWQGEIPPCLGYSGCETVNTSPFAEIFGIPTAAFGMMISALILGVSLYRVRADGTRWLYSTVALYALVLAAALFMAYLTGVEILVLHAICYWCVAMATFVAIMLVLVIRDVWGLAAEFAT